MAESRDQDLLEGLAKALGLGAILLPVAGAVLRFIAFITGIPLTASPYLLAWSAPVTQLAATGLRGLFPSILLMALFLLLLFAVRRWPLWKLSSSAEARLEAFRLRNRMPGLGLSLALLVVITFFLASWPTGIVGILGGMASSFYLSSLIDHPDPWRLRNLWPLVVAVLALGAVSSGLSSDWGGVEVGDYRFKAEVSTVATDGLYAALGESNESLYLMDCKNPGRVVAVSKSGVVGFRFQHAKPTSLIAQSPFEIVFRHKSIAVGFRPPC
jgi:hypothetical protein